MTIVELVMEAYTYELYQSLGVYLALIVVNCIILGRAEMYANKHGVVDSAIDGLGMGLGFTLALCAMATIREILGAGTFCGISSATVWENHLWIRSCYLPHLYNAEQSFCPERMIDRYANRYMPVARGVLLADERVLRHRGIRAGARAQEPD